MKKRPVVLFFAGCVSGMAAVWNEEIPAGGFLLSGRSDFLGAADPPGPEISDRTAGNGHRDASSFCSKAYGRAGNPHGGEKGPEGNIGSGP